MTSKVLRPSVLCRPEWFKRKNKEAWERAREQTKRRDNWTCVYCGFSAKRFLQVNHIASEDNHSLENLETVCKPCHQVLHIGINAMEGNLTVITSFANQVDIVRETRNLIHTGTPWSIIEKRIIDKFLTHGGRMYTQKESIEWANKILLAIPSGQFRGYLPEGLAVVFHEEGPWSQYPEAVHRWGM